MAKKATPKVTEATTPVTEITAPATEATTPVIHTPDRSKIDALVKEFDDCVTFAEFHKVTAIKDKITEAIAAYNEEAETLYFQSLKSVDDPMMSAVLAEEYDGLSFSQKKVDGKDTIDVKEARIPIDPERLLDAFGKHSGRVGKDPLWPAKVQAMSAVFIADRAARYGINPRTVLDTIAVNKAAKELDMLKNDPDGTTEYLSGKVAEVIKAMIGPGYSVPENAVEYLQDCHTRKSGKRKVGCLKPRGETVRTLAMEICNSAVTGNPIEFDFDRKKK